MLTRKPCKWCGSIWHSKNKCEKREYKPFQETYNHKRPIAQLSTQKPSQALKLAHKGNSERSQLIGYADKYHSAYIRGLSEYCYTCDRQFEELQNGHFMSRRFIRTRWDNTNCHPQCNECNVEKGGNLIVYEQRLRREYGDEAIDNLKQLARSGNKFTLAEIQEVIDQYSQE